MSAYSGVYAALASNVAIVPMSEDDTIAAAAVFLRSLANDATTFDPAERFLSGKEKASKNRYLQAKLPGPETDAKRSLEHELFALQARVQHLEAKAATVSNGTLPDTPNEPHLAILSLESPNSKRSTDADSSTVLRRFTTPEQARISHFLAAHEDDTNGRLVSGEDLALVREHVRRQAAEIKWQTETLAHVSQRLQTQKEQATEKFDEVERENINQMQRELQKHQQANEAFQKALKEIGSIITKVANGDLSHRVIIHDVEMDPEITTFKETINRMMSQLQVFGSEVSRVAREVGTEGKLGGEAKVSGVEGIWKELTENVNFMCANLTDQVREISQVTTAVAEGNLDRKIVRPAQGEVLQLQQTINRMVDDLRTFATEVTRVARDVGTEGILGGQARIEGVKGKWNELTTNGTCDMSWKQRLFADNSHSQCAREQSYQSSTRYCSCYYRRG